MVNSFKNFFMHDVKRQVMKGKEGSLMKRITEDRDGLGMKWSMRIREIWGWGLHKSRINAPPTRGGLNEKTRHYQ